MKKVPSQDYSKKGIINKADVIKVIWRQQKGMAYLIDGKKISQEIKDELKAEVAELARREKQLLWQVIQVWGRSCIQRICEK